MTEKKLTLKDAVKLAEEVVAGREDYIYTNPDGIQARPLFDGSGKSLGPLPKCVNWDVNENKPSCVVGHILYKFGVPIQTLINRNEEGVEDFTEWLQSDPHENDTFRFLAEIQSLQDKGRTWGDALQLAKDKVEWTS